MNYFGTNLGTGFEREFKVVSAFGIVLKKCVALSLYRVVNVYGVRARWSVYKQTAIKQCFLFLVYVCTQFCEHNLIKHKYT